jgi:hypothetical protein
VTHLFRRFTQFAPIPQLPESHPIPDAVLDGYVVVGTCDQKVILYLDAEVRIYTREVDPPY